MYHCAGLQPVPFAARVKQPFKLAGAVGLEPTRPFGSSVNSGVQYHYAYTPINLIETIFRQHTLSGCTRGEARVRFKMASCYISSFKTNAHHLLNLVADVRIKLTVFSL